MVSYPFFNFIISLFKLYELTYEILDDAMPLLMMFIKLKSSKHWENVL